MFRRNTRGPVARADLAPFRPRAPLAALEALEARRLFALDTWSFDPATLEFTVRDNSAGTTLVARQVYYSAYGTWGATVSDGTAVAFATNVRSLVVMGNDGNDNMVVDAATIARPDLLTITLNGGHGNDTLDGGPGNDQLYGRWGHDTIYGRAGNDSIWGDDGNDIIDGGLHGDVIRGGSGDDSITGGKGSDYLYGDAGDDDFFANDNEWDSIDGGTGDFDFADYDGKFGPDLASDTVIGVET